MRIRCAAVSQCDALEYIEEEATRTSDVECRTASVVKMLLDRTLQLVPGSAAESSFLAALRDAVVAGTTLT